MGIPVNWQGMMVIVIEETGQETGTDPNGAYLRDIVLVLKNQWRPRKHTENTEYSRIISVSSVDSVAIYHDFDSNECHSEWTTF